MGLNLRVGLQELNLIVEVRQDSVAVGFVTGVVAGAAEECNRILLVLRESVWVFLGYLLGVQVMLRDEAAGAPADDAVAELTNVSADGNSRNGHARSSDASGVGSRYRKIWEEEVCGVANTSLAWLGWSIDQGVLASRREIENGVLFGYTGLLFIVLCIIAFVV